MLALVLLALWPTSWAAGPAHVFRYPFVIAETGFDPAQISDEYSMEICANVFETLLTYDYLARPTRLKALSAAELPEISADFSVYTIKLKPGTLFADDPAFKGEPRELVAADYVYAIKRNFDPRLKSPNYANYREEKILGLEGLRGAAIKSGKPFDYDKPIEGLQALDRYTLRITLGRSSPRFSHLLAHLGSSAVAREVVERYGDTIMEHPVGTGAFRLSEWRRSSRMVLTKNPQYRESYYDERPAEGDAAAQAILRQLKGRRLPLVDRVEVSIVAESQPRWLSFLANDFDVVSVPYEYANLAAPLGQLAPNLAKRGMRMHKQLLSDVIYSYFNMEDPLLGGYSPAKVALRRAISLGYDNAEEARLLRKGLAIPAQGIVVPNVFGYAADFKTEMSEFNPAKARALLDLYGYVDKDGDGWRDQPDGSALLLEFSTQPDSGSRRFNELWLKYMTAIGLRIEFKTATWPEQMKMARAGKLMIWMLSWTPSNPDAESMLSTGYGPAKGEDNLARFQLPAYDALMLKIQTLPDGPERLAQIQQAERLLTAYMPMKAHVHRVSLRLSQPWVQGYQPHPFLQGFWRFVDSQPPVSSH